MDLWNKKGRLFCVSPLFYNEFKISRYLSGGLTPIKRLISCSPLKKITVGTLLIPIPIANSLFSSTLTLTNWILSYSTDNDFNCGIRERHGPHHVAEKQIRVFLWAFVKKWRDVAESISSIFTNGDNVLCFIFPGLSVRIKYE